MIKNRNFERCRLRAHMRFRTKITMAIIKLKICNWSRHILVKTALSKKINHGCFKYNLSLRNHARSIVYEGDGDLSKMPVGGLINLT